jgi:hypothetical protein
MPNNKWAINMNIFTIDQFKTLIANPGWTHENCAEWIDQIEDKVFGFGKVTSRLDDLVIVANEGYDYTIGDNSSFSACSEGLDKPIQIEGFNVVDEDGDSLAQYEIYELLNSDFYKVDYSEIAEANCHNQRT